VSLAIKCLAIFAVLTELLALARPQGPATFSPVSNKRPVTVADFIQMTRVAGSPYFAFRPKNGFAVFSPDRQQFVVAVARGNLERNTNDYSLLLFRTAEAFHGGRPRTLTSMSSSSNHLGMFDLKWSEDNDTIFFLGTTGDQPTQLFSVRCGSGELRRLTDHPTSLTSYAISQRGAELVFEAESPATTVVNERVLRYGLHVADEELSGLIAGKLDNEEPQLFVKETDSSSARPLHAKGDLHSGYYLSLSPSGRYLVLKTGVQQVPGNWKEYKDANLQAVFRRGFRKGSPTGILQYEVIDVETGSSDVLLNAPASYYPLDVLWSPDSKSLILSGVHLPLVVDDQEERAARRAHEFVVEIELTSRSVTKITDQRLDPVRWDLGMQVVEFHPRPDKPQADRRTGPVFYQKVLHRWSRIGNVEPTERDDRPEILVDEGMNLAPQIVALNPTTKQELKLLDLNPNLAELALGKVEAITWNDKDGRLLTGGLYLPPDYVPGKRYPLVIQTHGFDPYGFWPDGPYPTAFAAQALASKGMVVLQLDDIFYESLVTPEEGERVMRAYEGAVAYLDRRGIVDSLRVGLVGFSRTCFYVKYTLTHSAQRFAAAVVSDGVDAGYLQYLTASSARPITAAEFEAMIGSPPFNAGVSLWVKRSPGFLLGKVHTPLLIQALEPSSLLDEWEWFAGLKRLGRPVDLLYLPNGSHILVRPWDRLASQQGTVDWFCFWLANSEDSDPAKAEQYQRWRELRIPHASDFQTNVIAGELTR
jgi:hypothetical protein